MCGRGADAEPGIGPVEDGQDDPPVLDPGDANPVDVLEQHLEVPPGDYEGLVAPSW